uniref:Uncharacterized protein n=1 Tax=Arundo donax TaxID=35708 RepID=A0A0A9H056_ARUDO
MTWWSCGPASCSAAPTASPRAASTAPTSRPVPCSTRPRRSSTCFFSYFPTSALCSRS